MKNRVKKPMRIPDTRSFKRVNYPRTFPNLSNLRLGTMMKSIINSEENTINWLRENGLLPIGMYCKCGSVMNQRIKLQMLEGVTWRCPLKKCRNTASIRQHSLFSQVRQPLSEIVRFLYLWAEDLVETNFLMKHLGWSRGIVLEWKRVLRQICKYKMHQIHSIGRDKRKRLMKYDFRFNSKNQLVREQDIEGEQVEDEWRDMFGEESFANLVAQIREVRPVI